MNKCRICERNIEKENMCNDCFSVVCNLANKKAESMWDKYIWITIK